MVAASVLAIDADVVVSVVVTVVCDLMTDVVAAVLLSVTHTDIAVSRLFVIALCQFVITRPHGLT